MHVKEEKCAIEPNTTTHTKFFSSFFRSTTAKYFTLHNNFCHFLLNTWKISSSDDEFHNYFAALSLNSIAMEPCGRCWRILSKKTPRFCVIWYHHSGRKESARHLVFCRIFLMQSSDPHTSDAEQLGKSTSVRWICGVVDSCTSDSIEEKKNRSKNFLYPSASSSVVGNWHKNCHDLDRATAAVFGTEIYVSRTAQHSCVEGCALHNVPSPEWYLLYIFSILCDDLRAHSLSGVA